MPVRFLRNASELADVSWESPLPVQVANARPVSADTLLVATTSVTTDANRDLLGSTSSELPTLDGCGQYRKLVWIARRASDTQINYTIRARATDPVSGAPLEVGWRTIMTGNFPADSANPNWLRLDIPATGDGYWDQYRIEISVASGTVSLVSKIVGVR
ncbi:MAG: hypothetical protein K6U77_09290 [Armatimonadetes bacterium]|nr:hypothetical protein [Armatimonadota bacterium]